MSILFPKLNKPREWDYRPIYYDPEKERRKERLKELQEERRERELVSGERKSQAGEDYHHGLERGSFRNAATHRESQRVNESRKTNIRFLIILLALLLLAFFYWL